MKEALAYVDPGSGYVFLQQTSFLWGWLAALLMFFLLPLKILWRRRKKLFWIFIAVGIIVLIAGLVIMEVGVTKDKAAGKVLILGIDALDFGIVQRLIAEGRLPNFSHLKKEGSFSPLQTTNPAESVVAWSSFSTGLNPAGHGIFDFVLRNPKNYSPYLSLNEVSTAGGKPKVKIRRKGKALWNILSQNKIPAYIYFCPNTFPPEKLYGKMLSGMGVPDILGMMGKFSFYTTRPLGKEDKESRGRIIHLQPENGLILTKLYGPKVAKAASVVETSVPLKVMFAPGAEKVNIEFQGKSFNLQTGRWSDWQRISFKTGWLKKAHGIVRFYLKSIQPDFALYASPVNFNPQRPLFSLSYPASFSKTLAKRMGLFYTQGMPHDTWALSEQRLGEEAFLEHTDMILEERRKILFEELKDFQRGVFFFYFDTLDAIQHMFWRYLDQKHPLYEPDSIYQETVFAYYEKLDRILGEVLKRIDEDTTLIVLSDHGFTSFRRAVHLNRWLLDNGFLSLKEAKKEGKEFLEDVDWTNTKAYALGFGGIYLNRIGREGNGIVGEKEAEKLKKTIKQRLENWLDAHTGERPVKNVYFQEEIFSGPYGQEAPDLFIGFNSGYRASWQTALGGVPESLIEDNLRKWSGTHLVDPGLVPGVILINQRVELNQPEIIDIAPTVLGLFDIPKPEKMPGEVLFQENRLRR